MASPALALGIGLLLLDKTMGLVLDNYYEMIWLNYLTLTVTAIGTFMLLPKLSAWRLNGGWVVNGITFISLTSYSMYLLNLTVVQETILPPTVKLVMHYLWRFDEYFALIRYSLYWLLLIACSWLLYRFYEKPMTNLREYYPTHGHPIVKAFAKFGGKLTREQKK